jgi:hypothetical protein
MAFGVDAHAEGNVAKAIGNVSHAEGANTTATGVCSHAEGSGTTANSFAAHAEGSACVAVAAMTHAEGEHTYAGAVCGHAEGSYTYAVGNNTHAEGDHTTAYGANSHAGGDHSNTGESVNGFAHGEYIQLANKNEVSFGKYNQPSTNDHPVCFSYGNGVDEDHRENLFEITPTGINVKGTVTADSFSNVIKSTTDLTPGTSTLADGVIYLVYED